MNISTRQSAGLLCLRERHAVLLVFDNQMQQSNTSISTRDLHELASQVFKEAHGDAAVFTRMMLVLVAAGMSKRQVRI